MKKLLVLVIALFMVVALSACGDKSDGVVLNWNIGADPRTLDPGLNGASDGGDVINNTFEGLVREKQGEVFPGMATEWATSTDGLTVTFTMREGAKWSDGTALDADDFVRSWKRAMDPRNASEYSWIWYYTNVVGADTFASDSQAMDDNGTPDDDTDDFKAETDAVYNARLDAEMAAVGVKSLEGGTKLEVTLVAPTNWFVSLMAFYHFLPVPVGADSVGEGAWAKDPETAVSNGPFVLSSYTVSEGLQLVKNEEYWNKDIVQIDIINGLFIYNEYTAYVEYLAGDVDFLQRVPLSEIPILIAESDEFYQIPMMGTYYYSFNMDPDDNYVNDIGLWTNQKLRLALSYSIDREAITEMLGFGAIPAVGFIRPGMPDNDGNDFLTTAGTYGVVTDDGNFALAVTLFAQAAAEMGLTVGELQDLLSQQELLYNTSEGHQSIAALVQEMWEYNLGFTVSTANQDWAVFQQTRQQGDFSIARGGWLTDYMDPIGLLDLFVSWNYYNDPNFYNEEYDALIAEAKECTDIDEYYDLLYLAYGILMSEMPIIPIYHYTDTILVKNYVTGWGFSALGPVDFSRATVERDEE